MKVFALHIAALFAIFSIHGNCSKFKCVKTSDTSTICSGMRIVISPAFCGIDATIIVLTRKGIVDMTGCTETTITVKYPFGCPIIILKRISWKPLEIYPDECKVSYLNN